MKKWNWNLRLRTKWQTTAELDMRTATGNILICLRPNPSLSVFWSKLCLSHESCWDYIRISRPQLWRTTRFWSLPSLLTWGGGEFHPEISLPHHLLPQMDRQAVQSGAGGARLHPGIYLDLLPPLRTERDQLAGTQATKVGPLVHL